MEKWTKHIFFEALFTELNLRENLFTSGTKVDLGEQPTFYMFFRNFWVLSSKLEIFCYIKKHANLLHLYIEYFWQKPVAHFFVEISQKSI